MSDLAMNGAWVKWKKFWALPRRERRLFVEAIFLHLWVGMMLKVVPFRRIPRLFSSRQFETPAKAEDQSRTRTCPEEVGSVGAAVGSWQSEDIEATRRAIQRAGKLSPWKNRCLVSSLAGRCMLNRRKITSQLSLGMAKDDGGKPAAHAWLISHDIELVGKSGSYTLLYTF